jgi:RNA polymerase sigma factor (sigma-70 family)
VTAVAEPTAESDADLGLALQRGDTHGPEGLFLRYGQHIHDYAAHLTGNSTAAEDIVQATFVRAIEQAATLRDPTHVRAWLYAIAHNLAREYLTRDRDARHPEVPPTLPTAEASPEEVAVDHSKAALVWTAVASLEPRQQAVLDLTVRHGLSTAEVAEVVGLTRSQTSLVVNHARSALGHAIRSLLVAQSRTHCDRLAEMVPPGVAQLTPEKRRSVEHHMRHCAICKSRAALLTSPVDLLGGIALLPLPASLAHGWPPKPPTLQNAQLSAARQSWGDRLRSRGYLIGGLALLFLGGGAGGVVILHGSQRPATVIAPRYQPTPVAEASSFPTFTPFPTPPPPSPTPAPGQWGDAQALVRNATGYHVHYGSYYVYPDGGPAGNPLTFDLVVQPNGDYSGTYYAIDGYIGQFDIRRVGGVISVRHLNLVGNLGIQGAPPDAYQFFGITSQQGRNLGDSWLPLTGSAQQPAARLLSSALAPYVSAQQLADVVLAPPQGVSQDAGPGPDPGSTEITAGRETLTFRTSPDPFVALHMPTFDLRIDGFNGAPSSPSP